MAKNVVRSSMKKVVDYYRHFIANDKSIIYYRMKRMNIANIWISTPFVRSSIYPYR